MRNSYLVANSEPRDADRQARLNALDMQAVSAGYFAERSTDAAISLDQLIYSDA